MNERYPRRGTFYNKLVRDRIPELIEEDGRKPHCKAIDGELLDLAIGNKILEEAHELYREWRDGSREGILREASDVLEIVLAGLDSLGLTIEDLMTARNTRLKEKGGFQKKLLLQGVDITSDEPPDESTPRFLFVPVHQGSSWS